MSRIIRETRIRPVVEGMNPVIPLPVQMEPVKENRNGSKDR